MITDIKVKVADKVASVIGTPVIICGNSDYTVTFTFDEEWETLDVKTARFIYRKGDGFQFIDVTFSGAIVAVPILSGVEEVILGIYAGELHTTTPARIICKKSILCGASEPYEEPPADIYAQLLETINNLETLPTVSGLDAGKALMVREDGHWVVRCPDFMHDQNSGKLIRFFFGTIDEWNAWTGDKTDVLFVPTDDSTLDEIVEQAAGLVLEKVEGGEVKAKKAENAEKVNGLEIKQDETGVLFVPTIETVELYNDGEDAAYDGNALFAVDVISGYLKEGETFEYEGETLTVGGDPGEWQIVASEDGAFAGTIYSTVKLTRASKVILPQKKLLRDEPLSLSRSQYSTSGTYTTSSESVEVTLGGSLFGRTFEVITSKGTHRFKIQPQPTEPPEAMGWSWGYHEHHKIEYATGFFSAAYFVGYWASSAKQGVLRISLGASGNPDSTLTADSLYVYSIYEVIE